MNLASTQPAQYYSGIIVNRGSDLQFWHLTFQEYLAACAIAGLLDPEQHRLLLRDDKTYQPEWREMALLLAGVLYVKQSPRKVDALFSAVLENMGGHPTLAGQARAAGLLGAMVRDLAPRKYQPADSRYGATLNSVLAVFDQDKAGSIDFQVRLDAAEALGQAGDPRLAGDNWVPIPAGRFLMGSEEDEDERPRHGVELDSYEMGRYPVTVDEYREFLANTGHAAPERWDEQLRRRNHPVTDVSWFDAVAYCEWRSPNGNSFEG